MKTMNALLVAGLAIAGFTAGASADSTVATFADPSNGSVSLFQFNAGTGTLTGGYSGSNLLLQTPGLPAVGDIAGAQFSMTPLSAVGSFGNVFHLGAGQINFVDATNAPLLTISFGDAWLTGSLGLGASDFMSNSVVFSGPAMAGFSSISNEAFSFSFANPVATAPTGSFTTTSSFTSSALLVIPAPGTAALLGLGGLVVGRRRR